MTLTMTQTLSQIQTEQLQVSFHFQNGQQARIRTVRNSTEIVKV